MSSFIQTCDSKSRPTVVSRLSRSEGSLLLLELNAPLFTRPSMKHAKMSLGAVGGCAGRRGGVVGYLVGAGQEGGLRSRWSRWSTHSAEVARWRPLEVIEVVHPRRRANPPYTDAFLELPEKLRRRNHVLAGRSGFLDWR